MKQMKRFWSITKKQNTICGIIAFALILAMIVCIYILAWRTDTHEVTKVMMFQVTLDIVSLVYCLVALTIAILDQNFESKMMQIILLLILSLSATLFFDAMTYIISAHKWGISLLFVFDNLIYVFESVSLYLLWRYLRRAISQTDKYKVIDIINVVLFIVNILLVAINFFYPIIFDISENYEGILYSGYYIHMLFILIGVVAYGVPALNKKLSLNVRMAFLINPFFIIVEVILFILESQYYWVLGLLVTGFISTFFCMYVSKSKELVQRKTEMQAAEEMQQSMLPEKGIFDLEKRFGIWGFMKAAKEVGGDLYDYYMVDESHLIFCLGDVSGKGTASALFMARAFASLKDYAYDGLSPEEIFSKVNKMLCIRNHEFYFITLWLGMLDVNTGELTYVNAGMDAPLYINKDGKLMSLTGKKSVALGIRPNACYNQDVVKIEPEEKILLFSDGIVDEHDDLGNRFGIDRLKEALNTIKKISGDKILESIDNEVCEFGKGSQQYDDKTMVLLEYNK